MSGGVNVGVVNVAQSTENKWTLDSYTDCPLFKCINKYKYKRRLNFDPQAEQQYKNPAPLIDVHLYLFDENKRYSLNY